MSIFKFGKKKESPCCSGVDQKEIKTTCGCGGQCNISDAKNARFIVLGACCKKSTETFENTKIAVKELGFTDEVLNIGDAVEIAGYGVMSTPALVINGKVVSVGKLLKVEDVRKIIKNLGLSSEYNGNLVSEIKKLIIEWQHLDVKGETCDRCYDTGENLAAEIKRLKRVLNTQNIEVEYIETKLDDTQIPQSNTILFNGIPIESILNIKVSENYCESCTALLGTKTYCRTILFENNEYEDIPAKAIRQAAYTVLGLKEDNIRTSGNSGCCGNGDCSCS